MKLQVYILILSCVLTICNAQSDRSLKLHVVKEKLQGLKVSQPINDSISVDERQEEQFINFNPVITFKEFPNYLSINENLGDLSQVTVFTVYAPDEVPTDKELWKIYDGESTMTLTTIAITYSDRLLSYEGGNTKIPVLNTYVQSYKLKGRNTNLDEPKVVLGSFSDNKKNAFKGSIAEVLVYNKVLKSLDRQMVESALALKYGITLTNGKNYLSSKKKIIFNVEDELGFAHRIAGIGRDDNLNLYQKQSHSTQSAPLVTLALGKIALSNRDNLSILDNDTFLVWGDNNLGTDRFQNDPSNLHIPLMPRQWKIQATGKSIPELKTTLQLNLAEVKLDIENTEKDIVLAIDGSGEGAFLPVNTTYIRPSSITNDALVFENIQWDMDQSGSDSFSFGSIKPLEIALKESKSISCDMGNDGVLHYSVEGGVPPFDFELESTNGFKHHWKSTDEVYKQDLIDHLGEGSYIVKVTDAFGTQTIAQHDLDKPNPISVNLGEDRQLNLNLDEITLDAIVVSDEDLTYEWTSDFGFHSSNQNIRVSESGMYTVTVTSSRGCVATDSITIDDSFTQAFSVFPNQSKDGNYNIRVKLEERQEITIKVYDMVGRLISVVNEQGKSTYNIPGIQIHAPGTYMVMLQSKAVIATKKLVVE